MVEKLPMVGVVVKDPDFSNLIEYTVQHMGFRSSALLLSDIRLNPALFDVFLQTNDPRILVLETLMPYNTHWPFTESLLRHDLAKNRKVIHVIDDVKSFKQVSGQTDCEVISLPCGLDPIMEAVQKASSI